MSPTAEARADALVFFGATGDLAYKQVFPVLAALVARHGLAIPVIGVAKSGRSREELIARAKDSLDHHGGVSSAVVDRLAGLLRYVDGDYTDPATFRQLRRELAGARTPCHYLAISPSLFATVVRALRDSVSVRGARVPIASALRSRIYLRIGSVLDPAPAEPGSPADGPGAA